MPKETQTSSSEIFHKHTYFLYYLTLLLLTHQLSTQPAFANTQPSQNPNSLDTKTSQISPTNHLSYVFYGMQNSHGILGLSGDDAIEVFDQACETYPESITPNTPTSCEADLVVLSGSGYNFETQQVAEKLLQEGNNIYLNFHPPGDWEFEQIVDSVSKVFSGQPINPDNPQSVILTPELLHQYGSQIGFTYDPETKFFWYGQTKTDVDPVNQMYQAYLDAMTQYSDTPAPAFVYEFGGGGYFNNPQDLHPDIIPILSNFIAGGTSTENIKKKALFAGLLSTYYPGREIGCMFYLEEFLPSDSQEYYSPKLIRQFLNGSFIGQTVGPYNEVIQPYLCTHFFEQ